MADTVADVLDKAADLIAAPGAWYRGSEQNHPKSCYCAATAIDAAAGAMALGRPIRAFFGSLLPDCKRHDDTARIWLWNDAPERTQEEVVFRLREAAAVARERGQ